MPNAQNNAPQFEIIQMQPTNTNSLLVTLGDMAVIFDPWGRAGDWDDLLSERGLKPVAIYATHGHPDHISAAPTLADAYNIPWYMGAGDNELMFWGGELLEYFDIPPIPGDAKLPTDITPGMYEILPGINMTAIAAPGHSAGGMMYYFPDFTVLLTGDTLFHDSVGRTDFPTGNTCELRASIANLHDMNLPDETFVVHGHGIDSTIATLREKNPYFKSGCECEHKCPGTCKCHID